MTPAGFPHSDISGSTPACDCPKLFAANHVLHRLLTPRHSPCALSSLATNFIWNPRKGSKPPSARSGEQVHLRSSSGDSGLLEKVVRSGLSSTEEVPNEPKSVQLE